MPARWTYLTNHTHVLICLLRDPECLLRDVATAVGVTERAVQRIVRDLGEAGVLETMKVGRRNRYTILLDAPLRHPVEGGHTVGELLAFVEDETRD